MTSSVFCGCSLTQGTGLALEKSDPDLWVNILHRSIPQLSSTNLINLGVSGSTNEHIFLSALSSMLDYPDCRYQFVSWTALKRLYVHPSVGVRDTNVYLGRSDINDIIINPNITIPGKYIQDIRDRFFDLTNIHYDILKIFQYTKIIERFANEHNIQVFFVNALLPVDIGYFSPVTSETRLPTDTTPLTQQLLDVETRSDKEYFEIYDKIHLTYKNTGSLDCNWLNLDRGFRTQFQVDAGNDNLHPGPQSNKEFTNFLIEKIQPLIK